MAIIVWFCVIAAVVSLLLLFPICCHQRNKKEAPKEKEEAKETKQPALVTMGRQQYSAIDSDDIYHLPHLIRSKKEQLKRLIIPPSTRQKFEWIYDRIAASVCRSEDKLRRQYESLGFTYGSVPHSRHSTMVRRTTRVPMRWETAKLGQGRLLAMNFVYDVNATEKFIVAQTPLAAELPLYFEAILDQNVTIINIILSESEMANHGLLYFNGTPTTGAGDIYGTVRVTCKKPLRKSPQCDIKRFHIEDSSIGSVNPFIILYKKWDDAGGTVRIAKHVTTLCKLNNRIASYFELGDGKTLIHSPYGTGRSGTLVAAMVATEWYEKYRFPIDIETIVEVVQQQSLECALHTEEQYKAIYAALLVAKERDDFVLERLKPFTENIQRKDSMLYYNFDKDVPGRIDDPLWGILVHERGPAARQKRIAELEKIQATKVPGMTYNESEFLVAVQNEAEREAKAKAAIGNTTTPFRAKRTIKRTTEAGTQAAAKIPVERTSPELEALLREWLEETGIEEKKQITKEARLLLKGSPKLMQQVPRQGQMVGDAHESSGEYVLEETEQSVAKI